MIPKFLPVVRREDDECVVIQFVLDKGLYDTSDLMIKMRDQCVVRGSHLVDELRIKRTCLAVEDMSVPVDVFPCFPCPDIRRGEILVYVAVEIILGRIKRRMRFEIARHEEERLVRITAAEKVKDIVRHPVRRMVLFIIAPCAGNPAVAVKPCVCRIGINAEFLLQPVEIVVAVELVFVVRDILITGGVHVAVMEDHIVKTEVAPYRVDMHLADTACVIAGFPEFSCHRAFIVPGNVIFITDSFVMFGRKARKQCGPCCNAAGTG